MPSASPKINSRSRRGRGVALAILLALPSPGAAETVRITVLHTTDVHGQLRPTSDYEGRSNLGGFLRCAGLIRRLRAENPRTLYIDCGDLFQGSPESWLERGRPIAEALHSLQCDAWVLGNHDFDWGIEILRELVPCARTAVLAANISPPPGRPLPLPEIRPFITRDLSGVRVAIVGLTSPGIADWLLPERFGHMQFQRSVEALHKILPLVREQKPDIVIVVAHQGLRPAGDDFANEIRQIANTGEMDLIIGGHTHAPVVREQVSSVPFTQAGYHGIWVGQADLLFDTASRRITDKQFFLHLIDNQMIEDEELSNRWAQLFQKTDAWLSETVGETGGRFHAGADEYGRSPFQQLLCRAIAEAANADIVLHGALTAQELAAGSIRRLDVWRLVPFDNQIVVLSLTEREILDILEENARHAGSARFLGIYGASYRWENASDGSRIPSQLKVDGDARRHYRRRYSVAFNSYTVASGGRRFTKLREIAARPESAMRVLPLESREALELFIRRHSPLEPLDFAPPAP